jgi:peptidoglycan/xylan/chitin deacetylase (PgdA/CDA1 family)
MHSGMNDSQNWISQAARVVLGVRPPFVLCYHGVGVAAPDTDPHRLFVSRELFEHHLDVIEARGYKLITVSELWRRMHAGDDVDGYGSISFDDGLAKTVANAMPVLAERNVSSSMYVPTGLMGQPHPHLDVEELIISPSEVRELAEQGVEVGAHSVDHLKLTKLGHDEALDQMRRSRIELEDLLGHAVTSMAYPFGALNDQTIAVAREAGYETACACSGTGPWRALSIPREPIYPTATGLRVRLKIAGLYGPVHRSESTRRRFSRR